ncbi:MAG: DUF4175 domain-containing protein [Pirellulaceae bacterium]|jgi:hypothetical protein|nr:DUF4175 domain-containing protein [Pirellulaceae bacterium]
MASDVRTADESQWRQRVRHVARRARRLVRLHGAGWFVTLVVLAALGLGYSDYWLRLEDPGVRLISSIVLGLVIAWSGHRFVWGAWRYRCTDLHAARRIERRFPALGDVVSSAVAFSTQAAEDDTAGSWELRRTVMDQAAAALAPVDCDACLSRRRTLRAVAMAVAMITTVLVLSVAHPSAVGLAARRLLQPWGVEAWPHRHQLVFTTAPARIAAGQDFEVEVIDARGRLPDVVQIHYWFDGDDVSSVETHTMQPLGDKLTHRLTHVTRGLRYRATGGDDVRMEWHAVQVMEPPRVITHDLHLTPPTYTGLPPSAATGHFRALQGTRVAVRLRVNKPLRAARLETTAMGTPSAALPMRLDEDRLGCTLEPTAASTWEVERSGSYWFRFVDEDELESGVQERWDVAVINDLPPVVTLRQPAADLLLTARATVTLAAEVKDDLAIRSVGLDFHGVRASVPGAAQRVELWSGPEQLSPAAAPTAADGEDGVHRAVTYDWDLSLIPGLEPGTELEYRLVAADYRPQEGAGATRRITILSPEEHDERLMQRQAEILAQIAEVARMQEQNSDQTGQLAGALRAAQQIGRADVDQLQGAELNQRQIDQRLVHPADGLAAQVAELLRDFERNRVDHPRMAQQLRRLETALQDVGDTLLTQIRRQLLAALKTARDVVQDGPPEGQPPAGPAAAALADLLADVQADQAEVVRALQQWLGELSQWDNVRRLTRDAGRLRRDQEEIRQRTDQLRAATLSKDVRELPEDLQADLSRMSEQQQAVARRWDAWSERLREADTRMAATAPHSANPLTAARQMLERLPISSGMRDAARDVSANRLGQAVDRQDETIRQLQQVQDRLAQREAPSRMEMADRVAALAAGIPELLARQQRLEQQTRELHEVRPSPDAAADAWRAMLAGLVNEQAAVGEAVSELQQRSADITALAIVFQTAAEAATQAAGRLRADETGPVTWSWQQQVSHELQQVLAVLADASAAPPAAPDAQPAATETAADESIQQDPALLLQLKVVRMLQQELQRRTAALEEITRAAPAWDAQHVQLQQMLARRQDALADVLTRLGAPPSAPEVAPNESSAPPAAAPDRPDRDVSPPSAPAIDQQLLDDLSAAGERDTGAPGSTAEDAAAAKRAADPLPRIAEQMRTVAQRVRRREIAEPTQVAQHQIVLSLTELIDALAAQQAATGAAEAMVDRDAGPDQQRDDPAATGAQAAQEAAQPPADGQPAAARPADLARAVQDMWGHLPERYRRQVQNVDAVEFLPAYRTLIEDYYRRLSESRARRP